MPEKMTDTEMLDWIFENLMVVANCGPQTQRLYDTRSSVEELRAALEKRKGINPNVES